MAAPGPNDPSVTWNPGWLDQILGVLGTEPKPGYQGAQLAQRSMWNSFTWELIKSNVEIAELASGNPYYVRFPTLWRRSRPTGQRKPGEVKPSWRLSNVVELLPGDLIFTGTPPGIGAARKPQRYLTHGDVLVTEIEGIGHLTQHFVRVGTR